MTKKILLALLVLTTPVAFAQEADELITDRPDATESPQTIQPGVVQLEIGATHTHDAEENVERDQFEIPGTLIRIGLSRRIELRIGWDGLQDLEERQGGVDFDDDGSGDTALGFKIGLTENASTGTVTALLVETSLPTGSEGFTSDRADPSLRYIVAHELAESIGLGYNFGVSWATEGDGDERDRLASAFYTLATGFGLTDRLGAFVELFGELGLDSGATDKHSFDGGFTYLVRPNVQLDIAAGLGLNSAADDWFLGVGISARLPR